MCLWHRQLAEGEHRDPSQVSSLCSIRSGWGEILQIPCPMLQLRRCRWTLWPDWSYHSWRQAWSENTETYTHVRFKAASLSVNDIKCTLFWFTDIPSAPGKVVPTRNTDTSVVVSWEASRDAKELIGYYIEGSIVGSQVWEPCNNKPVNATR